MLLASAACVFMLAARKIICKPPCLYGRFARAKVAWSEASQQQTRLVLAAGAMLALYSNMSSLA
eukprot:4382260-Amphidinium_carterae.1